ncbi:MAG: cell division protein FtsZ [Bifidobacteriaceae bacterium]|nr:cell division protein FtsZ [Bifidobacteriaceae bacterium]MCI1979042.1 cell division protein FtsZ [Bifidobacteriaceae bacterium]
MSEIAQTDSFSDKTNIKVVGVGGAGGNALNRMVSEGLKDVEFIAVNTDAKDLLRSDADIKISLSDQSSRGLGAGADPEKGAKAAQDHQSDIEEALKGADMVFVTAGEGGGTGTGASPLVARIARQLGALTIAVVTRPFSFEGPRRSASADSGIENLRKEVDALIIIPNDRLLDLSDRNMTIIDAFKTADGALLSGIQGVTDLISANAYIHVDFNDVTAILKDAGTALFGIGSARGEDRATQAAEIAISSPLLEESIEGAHGVLVNIAGSYDLGMQEAQAAVEMVHQAVHPEAQIIWGLTLDDSYGDDVRVTVIAAGFDSTPSAEAPEAQAQVQSQPAPSQERVHKVEVPPIRPIRLENSQDAQQASAPAQQNPAQQSQNQPTPPTQERPQQTQPARDDDDTTGDIEIPAFLR